MKDILFQYYGSDIRNTTPLGCVSLDYWIKSMKNPKPIFKDIFEKIEIASLSNNKAEKDELKRHLYFFTPSVLVNNKRRYSDINRFTGLLTIDFDGLELDYAKEFKEALFKEYKFIICSWLSASKKGVRALIKIPISKNVNEFKSYYNAIREELSIYNGFDIATQNAVLPMFMSYDTNILVRENYTEWTRKYIAPEPLKVQQYFVSESNSNIEKIIISAINKITSNGHPQLRAVAFALGGYISAGYISESSAIELIENCINSNAYLSRKHNGLQMADVYKTTAKTMILNGQIKPLFIK